jgi:hypothetical protein
MKRFLLSVALVVASVFGGYNLREASINKVQAVQSFGFNDRLDDDRVPYLSAYGSWRGADLANKINTVRILCDPSTKSCDTTQVDVHYVNDRPMMMLDTSSFAITRLDKELLQAEATPNDCIRQVILFDRVAKQVSLVRTKVGKDDLCSMIQNEPVIISLGDPWLE